MSEDNLYAGPRANPNYVYEPREGDPVDAPRLTRLMAVLADAIVPVLIGVFAAIALPGLFEGGHASMGPAVILLGVGMLGWVIWNLMLFHREGQTFGKRMLGIRVVRMDGSRCSVLRWIFLRHFVTSLIGAIPFLGPFITLVGYLIIFREDSRCLHDHIADTRVVVA